MRMAPVPRTRSRQSSTGLALAVGAALLAVAVTPAVAQVYRWTDERGVPHYADGIESVPERFRGGAVSLGYRNQPSSPPSAGVSAAAPTVIRFTPGGPILVDARINGGASARLLLDTGADRTLIAPRALVAAGVAISRTGTAAQLVGVTGTAVARGVPIDSLEVGEARVGRMIVISHDLNQSGLDGLLGRDFLNQFHVAIDSTTGTITLSPR